MNERTYMAFGAAWRPAAVGVGVVAVFCLLVPARLWRPDTLFTIDENVQIAEARAWWDGRLELPERKWDTAQVDGRAYSHFPPMFSFVSAAVVPWFGGVPHWFVLAVVVLPVPVLAYVLFYRRTGSAYWGAALAIALVCGTSALPVLDKTLRGAAPYPLNQTLALSGVLLMLIGALASRRMGLACVGLVLAALSRQFSVLYAVPLAAAAWQAEGRDRRRAGLLKLGAAVVLAMGALMALNAAKFGNPLDSGYVHLYTDRPEDAFSRDARTHGLFSLHYVPRNLYYLNVGLPDLHRIQMAGRTELYLRPNEMGTGIWWTTPLLLFLFVDFRSLVRDPQSRMWLLAAAGVAAALLVYHSTGFRQRGINRYSLDFVPALMALIAPACIQGRRRWAALAMIAWSVFYFRFVPFHPPVRIW